MAEKVVESSSESSDSGDEGGIPFQGEDDDFVDEDSSSDEESASENGEKKKKKALDVDFEFIDANAAHAGYINSSYVQYLHSYHLIISEGR